MKRLAIISGVLLVLSACSTTRTLSEGQYRLASNEISIESDSKIKSSELTPYLRQQANTYLIFGWNPLLNIYNWSTDPASVWQRIGTAPVVFDPTLMYGSVENIKDQLEYLGYFGSQVTPELSTKGKIARVNYKVKPGHRIKIDSIVFDIPQGEFYEDFYADSTSISIKKGDYLSESSLEQESLRSATALKEKGYYNFNKNNYFFEADTLGSKSILYYRIKNYTRNETESSAVPIEKYTFRNVNIHHPANIAFRESLLRKLNTIKPGELYSENLVNTSYYRLSSLDVFNNVIVELSPVDGAQLDCDIRLNSSDLYGFKLNAEVSSNSSGLLGASPQLSFYHKNLFHGGERLNVSLSGNWQFIPGRNISSSEFALSSTLSLPFTLGLSKRSDSRYVPRTDLSASFNYQNRPEYTRSIAGFSYGYSGQVGQNFFYQVQPVQFNYVKLNDISSDFYQTLSANPYLWDTFMDQVDLGLGFMVYHITDPAIVPKGAYQFSRLSIDLSGNLISVFNPYLPYNSELDEHLLFGLPYNQYVRAELSVGKIFRFGYNDNTALAFRLNAGIGKAYGNSTALPFEKQFYCGGASSMRGWQVRTLGPGYSPMEELFIIPSQTGDMKLEADIEARFPLFWKFEGALFAEAGNIWKIEDISNDFWGSIAADWGLGLRLNLDFILLRLDAGLRVHDPVRPFGSRFLKPSEWFQPNGAAIHFGVGYPF